METRTKIYAFIAATLVGGAFLPIMFGYALKVNIYELFFSAFLISIPASLVLLINHKKQGKLVAVLRDKRTLAFMAAAAILYLFANDFGVSFAEHYISAALTTLIFRTNPLLMLIFIPFILKEKLSKYQLAALSLGVVGLIIGLSAGNPLALFSANQNLPIVFFMIIMALSYGLGVVLIRKMLMDSEVFLFIAAVTMTIVFGLVILATGISLAPLSTAGWAAVLYTVWINVPGSYMFLTVIKSAKLTFATNFYILSPFITILFASVLLGQAIEPYYLAIAALVTTGVVIQKFDSSGGSLRSTKKDSALGHMVMFDVTGAFVNSGDVGIKQSIENGGRILAVKMPSSYSGNITTMIKSARYSNIYMDSSPGIASESGFVKEIVGAKADESVVLKAGPVEEGENFFEDLNKHISESGKS